MKAKYHVQASAGVHSLFYRNILLGYSVEWSIFLYFKGYRILHVSPVLTTINLHFPRIMWFFISITQLGGPNCIQHKLDAMLLRQESTQHSDIVSRVFQPIRTLHPTLEISSNVAVCEEASSLRLNAMLVHQESRQHCDNVWRDFQPIRTLARCYEPPSRKQATLCYRVTWFSTNQNATPTLQKSSEVGKRRHYSLRVVCA
jgi:hypothetical protein